MSRVRVKPHQRSIKTHEAAAHQRTHHIAVQKRVQHIYPVAEARVWGEVYKAAGEEAKFGIMLTWLKLITLNEADGQPWGDLYDAALADTRLDDSDRNVLAELVLAMQERSLQSDPYTPAETERKYAELTTEFREGQYGIRTPEETEREYNELMTQFKVEP